MDFPNKAARLDYLLMQEMEGGDPIEVTWGDIEGKPDTFPPTIGTTATTAKAGNWSPTWAQVTEKPSTFPPSIGTTAATAKAGNWTPSSGDLPDATTAAKGAVRMAASVPDATGEEDVVATVNTLLANLRGAGIVA